MHRPRPPRTQSFHTIYDRYGNKTGTTAAGIAADSNAVPLDGLSSLSYNTANNRINATGWEYDLAGNQTRGQNDAGVWLRFEYDEAGRLVKTKDDAGNPIESYTYGVSRNRLINETSAGRTYYAWGGQAIIAEYFETSTIPIWERTYIYAMSRLLSSSKRNGTIEVTEFHHSDRLGTRLVTNPAAGTNFEQSTLPFGTKFTAESTGATTRIFTSYDYSSITGLNYAVNRTQSPGQGRFTQVDPIGIGAMSYGDPQSLNLYAYVSNNPIDLIDPTGLYTACAHEAMTRWLAKHAGIPDNIADQLAKYAGGSDDEHSADGNAYKATSATNYAQCKYDGTGPSLEIHLPAPHQLRSNMRMYPRYMMAKDYIRAAHMIHSVEDAVGAHSAYIKNKCDGHGIATGRYYAPTFVPGANLPAGSWGGEDPDIKIGDQKFINAANATLKMMNSMKPNLTNEQINKLVDAIIKECGDGFIVTRPPVSRGAGRRTGGGGGGGSGYAGTGGRMFDDGRQFDWLEIHFGLRRPPPRAM